MRDLYRGSISTMIWIIALTCVALGVIITLGVLDHRNPAHSTKEEDSVESEDYESEDYLWWMIR